MPHTTRHTKKKKKPQRTKGLEIRDDEQLREHRELEMLRIAGGARPGKRRKQLLNERFKKLDKVSRKGKEV